ncbi:pilus assembly FimT family protein [Dendrosporobacter sp. 1207_IL3150]|uniref:pilus assembly FimT family protein n=1 Tax=Dendrosporobacter sp. 1207_IL3150 TaxID=3084054 RepID=UPI002FDB29F1
MRQKGFTAIEVLIVIAILGLVAGIAVPRINHSMALIELDNAARELAADLRWLQQNSVNATAGSSSLGISSDPIASLYFYTSSPYGYYITKNAVTIKKKIFPTTVEVVGFYNKISFGTNGYIVTPVTINLRSGSVYKKVIVDAVGRIRIE